MACCDSAERDYGEILGYLNGTLCNPQAAANFSEKVRKAFETLDGDPLAFPECAEGPAMGFCGIFLLASATCFAMWNYACNALGVVRVTVGLYLTPIVGVIFAALFLGERLTMMSSFGGLVIIIGVALANWRKK